MDHSIRPLDQLSVNEICELAKQAAQRGESLEQANVFQGPEGHAFEAAYRAHAGD